MSYHGDAAMDSADEEMLEYYVQQTVKIAAPLIAAREMSREDAIATAIEFLQEENDAEADQTFTKQLELERPGASGSVDPRMIYAISSEIMDACREAVADAFVRCRPD